MTPPPERPKPGPGETRACPVCGTCALMTCWHPDRGSVRTVVMPADEAHRLRHESGEYDPSTIECVVCAWEGPLHVGCSTAPGGFACAACTGGDPAEIEQALYDVDGAWTPNHGEAAA